MQEEDENNFSLNGKSLYEDLAGGVIQNLKSVFRAIYKKVTEADIEEFEANYRGSDSEKKDLIDLCKKCKGNMNKRGELKETKAYQKWAKKVSQIKPPTSPLRRKGKDQMNSQNQIYLQLYLSAEVRGKTCLIPCFHYWCSNMEVMQTLNPLKKNLKLHGGKLKAERPQE